MASGHFRVIACGAGQWKVFQNKKFSRHVITIYREAENSISEKGSRLRIVRFQNPENVLEFQYKSMMLLAKKRLQLVLEIPTINKLILH